jgi:uncharacterized membrane protein
LSPEQEAELIYKIDVSKDAVPGKNYQLKILFEFSDSYRDDLSDWENAYVQVEQESTGRSYSGLLIIIIVLVAALLVVAKKRGKI